MLTRKDAWLKIAIMFTGPLLTKPSGICSGIDRLHYTRQEISEETDTAMRRQLRKTFWLRRWWRYKILGDAYYWPDTEKYNNTRYKACLKLARES